MSSWTRMQEPEETSILRNLTEWQSQTKKTERELSRQSASISATWRHSGIAAHAIQFPDSNDDDILEQVEVDGQSKKQKHDAKID